MIYAATFALTWRVACNQIDGVRREPSNAALGLQRNCLARVFSKVRWSNYIVRKPAYNNSLKQDSSARSLAVVRFSVILP